MSDDESSGSTSENRVSVLYRCRHCPGAEFTAAERDAHRLTHRRGRQERGSPPLTLFEPVTVVDEGARGTTGGKDNKARQLSLRHTILGYVTIGGGPGAATGRSRPKPHKRKSIKHFSPTVSETSSGG